MSTETTESKGCTKHSASLDIRSIYIPSAHPMVITIPCTDPCANATKKADSIQAVKLLTGRHPLTVIEETEHVSATQRLVRNWNANVTQHTAANKNYEIARPADDIAVSSAEPSVFLLRRQMAAPSQFMPRQIARPSSALTSSATKLWRAINFAGVFADSTIISICKNFYEVQNHVVVSPSSHF